MIGLRLGLVGVIAGSLSLPQVGWTQAGPAARTVRAELFRIPADPAGDDPAFHRIVGLELGPTGEVFVLDYLRNSIRVFSEQGTLVREFGRRGQGPGEFLQPAGLHLSPAALTVYDLPPAARLTTFSHAGEHLATWTPPFRSGFMASSAVGLRGGHVLVLSTPVLNEIIPGARPVARLQVVDSAKRQSWDLAEVPLGMAMAYYGTKSVPVAGPPGMGAVWAVRGDSVVAVANAYTGSIQYWTVADSEVRPLRTRQLGWTPEPVRVSAAEERATRERNAPLLGTTPGNLRIEYPQYRARVLVASFAANGDLWLLHTRTTPTASPTDRQTWTVVPWSERAPVFNVVFPPGFRLQSVRGDRLAGIHADEFGVQRIVVYGMPDG